MMGYYGNYLSGFGLFGPLLMIIFWGLIIWAIVALVRGNVGHSGRCCRSGDSGGNALDILKERYAKGEIKKEEYEQKKKDLA